MCSGVSGPVAKMVYMKGGGEKKEIRPATISTSKSQFFCAEKKVETTFPDGYDFAIGRIRLAIGLHNKLERLIIFR